MYWAVGGVGPVNPWSSTDELKYGTERSGKKPADYKCDWLKGLIVELAPATLGTAAPAGLVHGCLLPSSCCCWCLGARAAAERFLSFISLSSILIRISRCSRGYSASSLYSSRQEIICFNILISAPVAPFCLRKLMSIHSDDCLSLNSYLKNHTRRSELPDIEENDSSCRKHSVQGSQTSLHGLSRWEQGGTCQSSSNSQRNLTAIICLPLLISFSTRYVTIKPSIGVLSDSIQGRQTTKSMHLILWMKKACNSRTYNASSTSTMLGSIWKNEWKIDRCCQPCSEWSLCTINANLCLRS